MAATEETMLNDEVVISGISGLFPSSRNVNEFMYNLYNKVDMVTADHPRWTLNDPSVPKHIGNVDGFDKFDAQFFRVTYQLGYVMEPMARKFLEEAYGAIFDSGTSLASLKGKKIGVFIGSSFTDSSAMVIFQVNKYGNFIINGSSKAMFANRISYWLDGTGPSYGLDYSSASSTACLEIAYSRMKAGDCDAALVGGGNHCLYPNVLRNMRCAGLLCLDGKTKCFDKNGDGYVRADAVSLLFLQKAKDAKRIYAEVVHAKGEHKIRPDAAFLPLRDPDDLQQFLNQFYLEAKVDPSSVEYVEAHACAIAKADRNEMEAISNVFAKDKKIKIGSVKSNMGNSEPASGVTGLTKLCLAYQQGKLPANLHYTEPQDLPALRDRVQVVTENVDFNRGYAALNSFSFTGANYHVLLKGHYKKKDLKKYQSSIPQLVLASGRQEDCATKVFDILKSQPLDLEQIALLRNAFADDILGHTARGYALLDTNDNNETVCLSESVDYYPGVKQPVWFVFSGMGSQWRGMGADLMRIPIFAKAIRKCSKVLEPKGVDLIKIVTKPDNTLFDNILNSFIGISAVQIGLVDILKAIGIVPDYIIGHSLGETACGYQDDTFSAEETILCTYCRGKVSKDTPLKKGAMAAVGIGYKSMVSQCPPDIDIACHNSAESTTISGPAESMKKFVSDLTARGVFAREVPCSNIPYHSRYVAEAGSALLTQLREVIKDPKPRSEKWLSTSIPQRQWDGPLAKYSSAEYHTNNLLSPVLFEETASLIPDNAVVIEIAPHGLLQAILKRSHKNCTHIPLTKRGTKDGVKFLLEAIGKMYEAGLNPKLDALYPKIDYPVSTETPLLSHFVQWEHSEDWPVRTLNKLEKATASSRQFIMSLYDDDHQYLEGFIREGINVFPESAILVLVWETLAMYRNMDFRDLSVVFKNIHFLSEVVIRRDRSLKLSITINKGDSKFEVCHNDTLIATGVINGVKVVHLQQDFEIEEKEDEVVLNSEDIYRVFESRGFSYNGQFKSIHSSNIECNKARVKWTSEWVTFLDSLIQLNALARDCEGVSVPKFIRKLSISMVEQEITRQNLEEDYCAVFLNHLHSVTRCAGVEIDTITFTDKPVYEKECDVVETRAFFPNYSMNKVDVKTSLHLILQIVLQNAHTNKIKIVEISPKIKSEIITPIKEIADKMPVKLEIGADPINMEQSNKIYSNQDMEKSYLFVIENLFGNQQKLNTLKNISKESFVLAIEQSVPKIQPNLREHFTIITSLSDGKQILILLKRAHLKQETAYIRIGSDNKFAWVPRVYGELKTTKRVVLISERQPYCGVLGFVEKLRRDGAKKLSAVIIEDFQAASFNPDNNVYKDQIEKNLAINVLRKGQWGSYYYTPSVNFVNLRKATLTKIAPSIQDGLAWVEQPPITANNNLVQVSFAGLSLRDTEMAVSNANVDNVSFGLDFSGIDISGDRVMGITRGTVSSSLQADPDLLWPVPDHWSLEEAATVPLPYVHAYYCLAMKGELCKGQTVLVTGGTGAFGQAVISLCLKIDCNVFTTVSTVDKKKFLLKLFPELKEHQIGYPGDDTYHMVTIYTKNKGCDFVINSYTGSLREAAMKCVGRCGLFLDLSKYDMDENKDIGMKFLSGDRNYRAVDLNNIFKPENNGDKKMLQLMITEGIANGMVRPLTRVVYSPKDVSKAFRLLSDSKHRGRVLIRMRDPVITNQGMPVTPRITYSNTGVYIVINDNTDLGVELIDRLVKRGARKVVLHTKSRPVSGYIQTKFASWMKQDVMIKLNAENLQTEQGCVRIIRDATKIGSIKGIFIVQNNDSVNKNNQDDSSEEFSNNFSKLVMIASNLDVITRSHCSELSHFVILSPFTQNDGVEYSVSIVERICRARNDIGYPALVLRYNVLHPGNKFIGSYDKLLPVPRSALFDAMEKSLKLKHKYVRTFNLKNTKRLDFIQKISNVVGTKSFEDVNNGKTLGDFKLNNVHLEEIRSAVRETYQINYHLEKIRRMSIQSLKNLAENDKKENEEITSGPGVFYTHIESEEDNILNSVPVVPMITLLNDGTENDLDPQRTYLTMIPGFEGRPEVFTSIAERLKIQAVTIPLRPDMSHDSIPKMAAEVRKAMKTKFVTKSKFYLLGYSFGVNVALELAAMLEKEGHEGIVYCLDSSPEALRVHINVYLGNITQAQLQNTIIEHAYYLMAGLESIELKHDLDTALTWSEKVGCCLTRLKGLVNYSREYKKAMLESMYQRFRLAQEYQPEMKLRSELVLIKSAQSSEQLADDYGLNVYTEKEVRVFRLESAHASIPHDCRVSSIINRLLGTPLLEEFKKKNLCDSYFIEA